MSFSDLRTRIRNALHSAFLDQLTEALSDHPLDELANSLLSCEAFIQARSSDSVSVNESRVRRKLVVSQQVNLAEIITAVSRHDITSPSSVDVLASTGDELQPFNTGALLARESADGTVGQTQTAHTGLQDALDIANAVSRRQLGGLRPAKSNPFTIINDDDDGEDTLPDNTQRQMQIVTHSFPKRAKIRSHDVFTPKESSLTKFVISVWEQIHSGTKLEPQKLLDQLQSTTSQSSVPSMSLLMSPSISGSHLTPTTQPPNSNNGTSINDRNIAASFTHQNLLCRRITLLSRACRAVETIVQARWIEHFDDYVSQLVSTSRPAMSATKARQAALASACRDFGWREKELRNKMAIWRGYKEIKDAGGWAMLVFAGMGLYRLCKYRVGFDTKDGGGLKRVLGAARERVAVAADTLHPEWRGLLAVIGVEEGIRRRKYTGHPHDWVVLADGGGDSGAVVPLRETYLDGTLDGFGHVDECIVDTDAWGREVDPRCVVPDSAGGRGMEAFVCEECRQEQSDDPKVNNCYCFPGLFGCAERLPCPVQIFRTANGRNNGLQALVPFERGVCIGEFVGLITKGIDGVDVMDAVAGATKYQIWQGRQGNFTRFINHSCNPNAQFQRFIWLGTQRVILVSKGIEAGREITVDYSPSYWHGLSKRCLCGERCCRYRGDDRQ